MQSDCMNELWHLIGFKTNLHVHDEDRDICSHAKVDEPSKRLVWRQTEVEKEKCELNNPVDEIIINFFNEEYLEDLKLLGSADCIDVPLQSSLALDLVCPWNNVHLQSTSRL